VTAGYAEGWVDLLATRLVDAALDVVAFRWGWLPIGGYGTGVRA
jgi:hypothetical protein